MPSLLKALTREHVRRVLFGVCLPALASVLMLVDFATHASAQSDKVSRDLSNHLVRHDLIALDARAINKQMRETVAEPGIWWRATGLQRTGSLRAESGSPPV